MASDKLKGVSIAGIASAVPRTIHTTDENVARFGADAAQKIEKNTGVKQRHVSGDALCASDLCYAAAEELLQDLAWDKSSIEFLIFVSQTPDYILPATACALHGRLGLPLQCAAFDLNLGCSGYVYGLWVAMNLLQGSMKRGLLLVGDTISRLASPLDRAVAPLFGDAGSATALESSDQALTACFDLGTQGEKHEHLIVPAGGFRYPSTEASGERTERDGGNIRSDEDLFMNGAEIFTFTLRVVPSLVKSVLDGAGWELDTPDAYVFHQANGFINKHLAKRLKLPSEKVPISLDQFGNTSGTSIPLTLTTQCAEMLKERETQLVLTGFGVGLSWGSVALTCGPMVVSDLIQL